MLSIKLVRGHNDLTTGCYIGLDRTEWPAGLPLVSSLSNNAYITDQAMIWIATSHLKSTSSRLIDACIAIDKAARPRRLTSPIRTLTSALPIRSVVYRTLITPWAAHGSFRRLSTFV